MNSTQSILKFTVTLLGAAATLFSGCARKPGNQTTDVSLPGLSQPVRVSAGDADAAEPAVATSTSGDTYVVWVNHRQAEADVMLARITSDSHIDGPPLRVNSQAGIATAWRGDAPTIAIAPDGTIFVGWTARVQSGAGHATDIYLSASRDRGRTFDAPVKVNDDPEPVEHGMHSLTIARDGRIYVAWLDERNITPMPMKTMMKNEKMDATTAGKHTESNRELFIAASSDSGRTFSKNERVATNVCPCCKTALVTNSAGRVYVGWRQVLPGDLRHIAVASSPDQGKTFTTPVIVSDDQWVLAGCPVSGATLAANEDGSVRALWYSEGKNGRTGLYTSTTRDNGATFSPRQLVAAALTRGTPVLISGPDGPAAIWQQVESNTSEVRLSSRVGSETGANSFLIAGNGESPAAAAGAGKLFLAYIAKGDAHRDVWLVTGR